MNRAVAALTACLLGGCTVNSGVETTPTFTRATAVEIPQSQPYTGPTMQAAAAGRGGAVGMVAVAQANRDATVRPTASTMEGGTWLIKHDPTRIYEVAVAPEFATTILLPPGEQLNQLSGGNVDGFVISGAYVGPRPAITVLPRAMGMRGNLKIATTGDLYSYRLVVNRKTAVNVVDVTRDERGRSQTGQREGVLQVEGNFTRLSFSEPDGKRLPAWAPAEVWADNVKMVVRFNAQLPVMPGLFAGQKGEQAVTYHTIMSEGAPSLVTDRRVTEAELRVDQEVIRITGQAAPAKRTATNTIDPSWVQAETLPEQPAGQPTINLVVLPSGDVLPAGAATGDDLYLPEIVPVTVSDPGLGS